MGRLLTRREEGIVRGIIGIRARHASPKTKNIRKEQLSLHRSEVERFLSGKQIRSKSERRKFCQMAKARTRSGRHERICKEDRLALTTKQEHERRRTPEYKEWQRKHRKTEKCRARKRVQGNAFAKTPKGRANSAEYYWRTRLSDLKLLFEKGNLTPAWRYKISTEIEILGAHVRAWQEHRGLLRQGRRSRAPRLSKKGRVRLTNEQNRWLNEIKSSKGRGN